LEAAGLAETTIVILTADHGELGGAHGLRQKDGTIFKENVGVPFVVRHPASKCRGAELPTMVSAIDIAPTLLAAAGVSDAARLERHPTLAGRNLLPLILDGKDDNSEDRGILFQYGTAAPPRKDGPFQRGFCQAIVTKSFKFGRWFAGVQGYEFPLTLEQLVETNNLVLYDRLEDPHELCNLANSPALIGGFHGAGRSPSRATRQLELTVDGFWGGRWRVFTRELRAISSAQWRAFELVLFP